MKPMKAFFGVLTITGLTFGGYAQSFLTNGLVAYYQFNGNANDTSGNGNHGAPSAVTPAVDRVGMPGGCYQFNGSNSVILVSSLASTNLSEITLSVWVMPFSLPSVQWDLINKWRGFSYSLEDYSLNITADLRANFGNGRHGNGYFELPNHCAIASTNSVRLRQWNQIVVTLDSTGTAKMWVNGKLSAQDYILTLLPPATEPVRLGQLLLADNAPFNGSIVDSLDGLMDDIRIYNRALPESEVQQLYLYETGPRVDLIKAVKPSFYNLTPTTNYQLQVSADTSTWTNTGAPFTATNTEMVYPQYWDVVSWNQLFFRLQVAP